MKNRKFIIGGVLIFLAIGYLIVYGIDKFQVPYFRDVSEFLELGTITNNGDVQIAGDLAPGSVEKPEPFSIRFDITDGGKNLPVHYKGVVPDSFEEGNELVIVGYLDGEGVFQAHTLLVKCPSKYVPEGEESQ